MPVRTDRDPRRGRLRGWRAPIAAGVLATVALGALSGAEGQFPPHIPFLGDRAPAAGPAMSGPATHGTEGPVPQGTEGPVTTQDLIAHPGKYFNGKTIILRPFTNSNVSPSLDNPAPIQYESSNGQQETLNGATGTIYSRSSFEGPSLPAIMSAGVQDNVEAAAQGEDGRGRLPTISVEIVRLPDGQFAADIIKAVPVFPKDFKFGQ